ncbi:DUF3558 domain-containing protein [Nocardia nova]|nr:DUF3558 domain-containing protein [Nocardia nova]
MYETRYALPTAAVSAAAVLLLSACGSTDKPTEDASSAPPGQPQSTSVASATPPRPTLTAEKLQPPSQDNEYTRSSGKPKVSFDPCTWIPDGPISNLGFNPSTRERGSDIVAEYTFLTCDFNNEDVALQLDSGNIGLNDVKQKYLGRTQDLTINERPAIMTPSKTASNDCSIDIETEVGYFGITVIVNTHGGVKGLKPCDRIVDIATTLEPYIGKDN